MLIETRVYDFDERLTWSAGFLDSGVSTILRSRIPGCYDVVRAEKDQDRNGTDYWALRHGLPSLSVDVKVRNPDYSAHPDPKRRSDDLALETWSVANTKIGWTRDTKKRTDYVLWFWTDTQRFFLASFPALCATFTRYWEQWRKTFPTFQQTSQRWKSECVFVPRVLVIDKMVAWQNGAVPTAMVPIVEASGQLRLFK